MTRTAFHARYHPGSAGTPYRAPPPSFRDFGRTRPGSGATFGELSARTLLSRWRPVSVAAFARLLFPFDAGKRLRFGALYRAGRGVGNL
jgi:hypothetical protein